MPQDNFQNNKIQNGRPVAVLKKKSLFSDFLKNKQDSQIITIKQNVRCHPRITPENVLFN